MPFVFVLPVPEREPNSVFRQNIFYAFRPFNERDVARVRENFFKADRRKMLCAFQPVGIRMKYICKSFMRTHARQRIAPHNNKGRA